MWILESDGDFLQGKRIWLRPGKKYLFGRVSTEGSPPRNYGVDHRSISRKHLVVCVAPVKPGDGSRLHTRSLVTLEDQGSKIGTKLDGEKIEKGGSKTLNRDQHTIKLGNYDHLLRIKWQSVVITYSLNTKEIKSKDPLSSPRSRLEELDIKTIEPYQIGQTSHVVATKRNTPKGLQALINGKYIITDSYIDALVYAATPEVLDSPETLSPLERDFDASWPDPMQHLPPKGKEPTGRPFTAYAPNEARMTVFEHFTFIFLKQDQFDILQPVITNGHGKALFFHLEYGKTSVDELIKFAGNAADGKGLRGLGDSSSPGGVVIVKFPMKADEEWPVEFIKQIAVRMDQRLIEQSDFLDAILANDANVLKRTLEDGRTTSSRPPPSTVPTRTVTKPPMSSSPRHHEQPPPFVQESQPPPKRTRVRATAAPRFKAFDDGFDMDSIPAHQPLPDDPDEPSERLTPDHSFAPSNGSSQTKGQSKKRRRPSSSPEASEGDVVDDLLPAATAMKRRRLEIERENRAKGIPTDPSSHSLTTAPPAEKPRPKKREIDVIEVARERRRAEEEAAKRDRENLQAAMEGMNATDMKNLAVVEEMKVPERRDRPRRAIGGGDSERWDERWNGRQNFKKFRRSGRGEGASQGGRPRMQAVIVPLVEVKKKDFGIGDEYWYGGRDGRRREKEPQIPRRGIETQTKPQAQTSGKRHHNNPPDEGDIILTEEIEVLMRDEPSQSPNPSHGDGMEDKGIAFLENPPSPSFTTARSRLEEAAAAIVGRDAIDVDAPRTTRRDDRDKSSPVKGRATATVTTKGKDVKGKGKRAAEDDGGRGGKRARGGGKMKMGLGRRKASDDEDDSDDDDGDAAMKFRFRRRR